MGSILNQLKKLPEVMLQLANANLGNFSEHIKELAAALTPLSVLGKSQLGSTLNQLKKLSEIATQLNQLDFDSFA